MALSHVRPYQVTTAHTRLRPISWSRADGDHALQHQVHQLTHRSYLYHWYWLRCWNVEWCLWRIKWYTFSKHQIRYIGRWLTRLNKKTAWTSSINHQAQLVHSTQSISWSGGPAVFYISCKTTTLYSGVSSMDETQWSSDLTISHPRLSRAESAHSDYPESQDMSERHRIIFRPGGRRQP